MDATSEYEGIKEIMIVAFLINHPFLRSCRTRKFTDSSVAHFVLVSVVRAGWCTTVVDKASKKFQPKPQVGILPANCHFSQWAMLGSNQRPLPCEGSTIDCWRCQEIAKYLQIVVFLR
jgi:hypothetical protein